MLFEPTGILISLKNSIRREKTSFFSGTTQPKYLFLNYQLPLMKWESILLITDVEKKTRTSQQQTVTENGHTCTCNLLQRNVHCKGVVFTGIHHEVKRKVIPLNTLHTYTFIFLLLGHSSASTEDLRRSSQLISNRKLWLQSVPWGTALCSRAPMCQHCWSHSAADSPSSALCGFRKA